jgi:Zn-dependent protease with chaperone function
MMSAPTATADGLCPSCSAPVAADPRFSSWCSACDWNVDPTAETSSTTGRKARRQEARRAADRAVVERLFAEVSGGTSMRPGRGGAWFAAMSIAGLVHLITVALTAGSGWLLVTGNLVTRFIGVVGLAVAFLIRPRLGRFPHDEWSLTRAEAPHLYGLADRVAAELGGRPVDLIRVTPEFNASYGRAGLRRRSVLTIGLALWELLTPQARVAVLGHEFGHGVNGDSRRGLWLGSASGALIRWYVLTRPSSASRGSETSNPIADVVFTVLLIVPHLIAALALSLLHRFTLRDGQRAEYLADDLAARVASPAAARSMLDTLMLDQSVETSLQRQAAAHRNKRSVSAGSRETDDLALWQELQEYIASVPEIERVRRFRLSALHMSSVDRTHPPSHLRAQLVATREARPAAVTVTEPEMDAIESELTKVRARAARVIITTG